MPRDASARPRRLTITDSIQPISNGLYAQYGLLPATPMLALAGTPRVEEQDALEPAAPTPEALAALDAAGYGFDRAVDHAYWREVGRSALWLRGSEPAAYTYVVGDRVGPVAGADPQAAAHALRAELARAEREVRVLVPGTSRALVEAAVAAGLRIQGPPGLLLLSARAQAPTSLAISGYTIF